MFVGSAHQRSRKASQEIFKQIPSFSKGLLDASGFRLCRQQLRGACWFFNPCDRCVGNSMASQADRARETMRERDVKRRRRTTTEIRFEVEELYLLRKAGKRVRAWCEGCGREGQMTTA